MQTSRSDADYSAQKQFDCDPCVHQVLPAPPCGLDKSQQGSTRLALEQRGGQEVVQHAGSARGGSNGNLALPSSSSVLLSTVRRGGPGGGRVHSELEQVETRLCVPKPGHDPINLEQDLSVRTDISVHCDNSLETQSTVVPQGNCTRSEEASQVTDQLEDGDGLGRQQLHPGHTLWREDKVRRLAAFRQGRAELGGLSSGAIETLQQSWAENTQSCYGLGFRYYTQFCRRNNLDELTPSTVNLINFLQYEHEVNKRQYRTLNSYRSAVSSTLGTCPLLGKPVGQDPLVCRFLRGIFRQKPPKAKLFPSWDVSQVLNYLKTWGVSKNLSLKQLLMKTAFLVALVCCKRPADLCNMQIVEGYWQLSMERFTCQPLGMGKTEVHHPAPPLVIQPFNDDPSLCPVYHLVRLDKKLKPLRPQSVNQFWISSKQPHQAVTVQTMCRWLKDVIVGSGAVGGTARDVRSVGASTLQPSKLVLILREF